MAVTTTLTITNKKAPVRKPKLAPLRIANIHHVQYLQEKALERDRKKYLMASSGVATTRPISVPGRVLLTVDGEGGQVQPPPSRPSTRNTVKDGIILRWEAEQNLLLRRPRTSSLMFKRKVPEKLNKDRTGVMLSRAKARGIVNAMTQAASDAKNEKTAADMCLEVAEDPYNPYKDNRECVLRQYKLWNAVDIEKTNLPPVHLPTEASQVRRSMPILKSSHVYTQSKFTPMRYLPGASNHPGINQLVNDMRGLL